MSAMAIVQDPSTPAVVSATGTTTLTLTTASFSPPAGTLLLAAVGYCYDAESATGPTLAISDSKSGTYTAGPSVYDTAYDQASLWTRYLSSAPGSMTVTVTDSGAASERGWILAVYVLAGAAASQSGAASSTTHSTGATAWTGSITTTTPGSWVLITAAGGDDATITVNSGTTTLESLADTTDIGTLLTGKQTAVTGTPGASTLGWTSPASTPYAWAALEILPAPVPPAGPLIAPGRFSPAVFRFRAPAAPVPPIAYVSDIEAGAGTDTGQDASATVSDTETGTGADAGVAGVSDTETGSGADAASQPVAEVTAAEAGTGTDAGEQVGVAAADTGSGADTATAELGASDYELGTGTEATSITATLSSADTGGGAEASSIAATLTGTDTGSGAETATVAVSDTDTGSTDETAGQMLYIRPPIVLWRAPDRLNKSGGTMG